MQFAKLAVKYMIFRLFSAIFAEMLDNIYIYILVCMNLRNFKRNFIHFLFYGGYYENHS